MQNKFRLYHRYNGTFYAQEIETGRRESLKTKQRATAEKKLAAMNQATVQPAFNREMARVYLRGTDPDFCERVWKDVADVVARQYQGGSGKRWAKFIKSAPLKSLLGRKLAETGATEIMAVLDHPKAGVSTNTFLRILHNRALDMEWLLKPALSKTVRRDSNKGLPA